MVTNDFYCDDVLSGRTPVETEMETEHVLAFRHTRPSYQCHIVVIPKRHIGSLIALDEGDDDLLLEMMAVVQRVAGRVVAEQGRCRVVTNLGTYQESKHLHWHIIAGAFLHPESVSRRVSPRRRGMPSNGRDTTQGRLL
jgi:histidine triad (HIT) family protein